MNPEKYLLVLLALLFAFSCEQEDASVDFLVSTVPEAPSFLINSRGDSIPTGEPLVIAGRKIALDEVSRSEVPAGPPRKVAVPGRVHYPPEQLMTHSIRMDRLRAPATEEAYRPGQKGFAYPTGRPVLAKGERTVLLQPVPTTASLPVFRDNSTHHIKYLDEDQGMNSPRVNAILEDKRGNLWFGTHGGGISKYDGARFTHYTAQERLLDDIISTALEDQAGKLWFGTWNSGVTMFDGSGFTSFTTSGGLISNEIRAMHEDRAGNIWLGTMRGGLCKYDGEHFTHYTTREGLSSNTIMAILEDRYGDLWLGTGDGGVNKFDGEDFYHITTENGLGNNTVFALAEDHDGNIWFATNGGGLSRFDGRSLTRFSTGQGLSDDTILSLYADEEGLLWIGTESGGVNIFNGDRFTHLTMDEGLSDNTITSITEDSKGGMWFGTRDGGVNIYNRHSFVSFSGLDEINGGNVRSILEDSEGDFWLATWGGGILRYDGEYLYQYTSGEGAGDNTVWALQETPDGDLWFGTQFAGLGKFDGNSFTQFLGFPGLSQFGIWSMLQDRHGHLWMGTEGEGIFRYDGASFTQYSTREGFAADRVWSIIERKDGAICFATWGGGVGIFDGQRFTFYTEQEGLISNDVWSILEDKRGNLWLGTYGGGVSIFDGKDFFHITTDSGLPSNIVNSIFQDESDNIWLGTEKGLVQISLHPGPLIKAGQNNHLHDSLFSINTYSTSDGLKAQDFNVHSGLLDSRDRFWLGTGKGLVTLDLDKFKTSENIPVLHLDYIEVNGQFLDYRHLPDSLSRKVRHTGAAPFFNLPNDLELSHDKDHLTFHFSALDYEQQHDIEYSYKIPELNTYWSNPSTEAKADYQNIPYGNYTFQLRARGKSKEWSEVVEYPFFIAPPWWRTWWAYSLYVLFGILLLLWFYLYQRRQWQLRTRLQLELERAERLKEVDELKSRFYTNITHEFRTPLTVIKGMAEEIREPAKIKELIRRNTDRLLTMVNQLLDLSKLDTSGMSVRYKQADIIPFLQYLTESCHSLAEKQQLNLAFFSREEELIMDFDENKVQQILVNLISNAVKFTPVYGSVKVIASSISRDGRPYLEIIVRDTGKGIPADKLPYIFDRFYQVDDSTTRAGEGSGIGLALVRELVELLDGRIEVSSAEGKGASFAVYLPIHQQAETATETELEARPVREEADVEGERDSLAIPLSNEEGKPQVLVIEDNQDVTAYIFSCLKHEYQLDAARDGKAGLEKALEQIPDVILCDIMMPEMDGFEVCRRLKHDKRTSHVPVILLTAKATQEDKVTGLAQGANAYLTKPFDKNELLVRLHHLAAQSRLLRERLSDPDTLHDQSTELEQKEAAFLQELNQVIEANLNNELFKTDYLCRSMIMSRSQLYRKLRALTGQSTAQYIRSFRLKKAQKMLQTTDLPVGEVALQVGYKDFSHFSRSFQKEFGVKPSEVKPH